MIVNKVQTNNNASVQFKAHLVDSASLRRFKAGLSPQKAKELGSYIKTIEEAKCKNTYIFDYVTIMNRPAHRRIATINILNSDKTINHTSVFSETEENAMNVFNSLADSLKK